MDNAWVSERVGILDATLGIPVQATPLESIVFAQVGKPFRKFAVVFHLAETTPDTQTVLCEIYQADDAAGANPVRLKSAVILAAHGSDNDGVSVVIDLKASEVEAGDKTKDFIGGRITVGNADSTIGCAITILGMDERHGPINVIDAANIVQIARVHTAP